MHDQEEQDFLDQRFGDENCDDCAQDADAHSIGLNASGQLFAECADD